MGVEKATINILKVLQLATSIINMYTIELLILILEQIIFATAQPLLDLAKHYAHSREEY
jgi:hypothetical protein